MVVVVCPSSRHIHRNLDYFRTAGFRFPDIAVLDGTQVPHEERSVYQAINLNQVRLLYTTPERFISLTFLQMLVHTPIHFLVIEEADRLLPAMHGHAHYRRFYEEGLYQLSQLPPIVLLTPPLPPLRIRELAACLRLPSFETLVCPPVMDAVEVQVRRLFTEHQKFNALAEQLAGNPGRGKLGRLDGPGSVLIQVAYPAQAEKLGASLLDYGFESIWISHFKKTSREQAQILDIANTRLNTIVINAGSDMRYWAPPYEAKPRMVFWTPPLSVEDVFMQIFRQTQGLQAGYDEQHRVKGLVFHTKEDFQATLKRIQYSRALDGAEAQEKLRALKHYRRWVLSEDCRLQSLAAYYQGVSMVEIPPCGICDRCRAKAGRRTGEEAVLPKLLKHWMY